MRVFVAVLIGAAILWIGLSFLGAIARSRPRERAGPEEVAALAVYFVCGDCGTELRVERIGELQIPRHCGEPMRVERRPPAAPQLN